MASLTQAIATYSFVDRPQIDLGTLDPADADAAMLARIGSLMASAASSFNGRNYDAAITRYHAAESLIYAHLDPQWVPELGGKFRLLLPRDPALFPQLLSATTQWLNILAVPTPASPVRPTTAVNAQLLSSVSRLHGAGLTPVSANPLATAEALADIRLASIYTDQQNTAASATVVARAKTLDSTIATTLTPATAAVAPAIAARPADVSPAAPSGTAAISTIARPISQPIQRFPTLPITVLAQKQVGLLTGSGGQWAVKPVQWTASGNPDPASIQTLLYAPHVTATVLPDTLLNVTTPWEQSAVLPHDYYYVIPLALAECYQAMGDFATAETYFILAASYAFINTAIEGPYVWVQLATLYLAWGNSAYQQGDLITATAAYSKAITFDSTTPPSTPLYTLAGLAAAATIAKTLIPQLTTLATNGVSSVSADDVAIAAVLLQIYAKEKQINAGLDYWANYSLTVPIWTFAYLQQVAITVTQLALQAEQEVVNYWAQADQATLTQTQLTNQAAQAKAQISSAQQQLIQAQDQVSTYQAALTLAQTRATDAAADASEYASVNSQAILIQAVGTQVGGGDNGDFQGVSNDASQLLAGQTVSGDSETLSATNQLAASRLNQSYQVDSMTRTTTEMQQAVTQAQTELTAANAQVAVAQANVAVAQLASNNAAQTVAVFNADTFSPQVWRSMGNFVKSIYDRYMSMALQAAKQMQQAYNFENDTTLTYINDAYPGLVDGLFGADSLMADIQSFTNDLITSKRGKKQYVKTSISLATNYGYLFETQLRKTGTIAFETTLDDFDTVFPGSYQGRIQKVSVAIQGIVPPTGVSGYLSNGGVSIYRLPSDIATSSNVSKIRLQNAETLILSDYDPTIDGVLDSSSGNQMGIFEGAGVASTWTLSLPPALNDINYGTLTDVVLTFLYETRYDPQLTATVLAQLASRPGFNGRERAIPLAWLYPDLFYAFISTGALTLSLAAADFPMNQTAPAITAVSLLVSMAPGTPAQGITVALTAPGKAALTGVTDSTGAITSQGTGAAWAAATGGSALGNWTITLTAAANPSLAPGGTLNLSALINLVLVLDYNFTPRG